MDRPFVDVPKICSIGQQLIGVIVSIVEVLVRLTSTWSLRMTRPKRLGANRRKYVKMAGFFGHQCKTAFNFTHKAHVIRFVKKTNCIFNFKK
jgi:hypothetical protein